MVLNRGLPKRCTDNYLGVSYNIYIYIKDGGGAYDFQFLRNPKRWLFTSDKIFFFIFRITVTGQTSLGLSA